MTQMKKDFFKKLIRDYGINHLPEIVANCPPDNTKHSGKDASFVWQSIEKLKSLISGSVRRFFAFINFSSNSQPLALS